MWMLVIKENNIKHAQAMGAGRHFLKTKETITTPPNNAWLPVSLVPTAKFAWILKP